MADPAATRGASGAFDVANALASTVIPSAVATRDGRFLWVNEALCSMTGYDEAALLTMTWEDITHPDERARDAALLTEILAGETPSYRMRKRYVRADGETRWGDLTVTAIRDDAGTVVQMLRQVIDVTAVVAAEEAQAESVMVLRQAVDAQISPEIVATAKRNDAGAVVDLVITEVNQAATASLGRNHDDLVGRGLLEAFDATPDRELWRRVQAVLETGEPLYLPLFRTASIAKHEERVYEIRAARVDDGIALAWRDITEIYQRTDEELRRSNEQYRLLIDNTSDIVFHTAAGIVQWISPSCVDTMGWTPEELVGRPTVEFWHPDDRDAAISLRDAAYAGERGEATLRWRCKDGEYVWLQVVIRPVAEADGSQGAVGVMRDVSAQVEASRALAVSEARYRLLAENVADVVGTCTVDGKISWLSESVHGLLGWDPRDVVGRSFIEIVHPEEHAAVQEAQQMVRSGQPATYDVRLRTSAGGWRWVRVRVRPTFHPTGALSGVVAGWQDINDRVEATHRLEAVLGTDWLTGLPNRATLTERIEARREQIVGSGCHAALLCIGIDRLGDVNSAINHAAGDHVLATVARRIAETAPDAQLVGRGSGIDFLVLLPDLDSASDAVAIAERLRAVVRREIVVDHRRIRVTASIGIASCDGAHSADDLIRSATLAMQAAKDQGRDRLVFDDPSMREEAERLMTLAEHARDGIVANRFLPWFMPIVDLETREVIGYEALMRWDFPGGVLEPKEFMTALIESRLIGEVDRIILRQSIGRLVDLPSPQFMSVNVSAQALAVPGFSDDVLALVHDAGADPARLHLELTETSLFRMSKESLAAMTALAEAGVKWYVDDFGTGYSSLSHLHDLPIAGLKLDTSFTRALLTGNSRTVRLTQALAGLSLGLELDTVAEGIEEEAQAAMLWSQGWRLGQGYLFGQAEPVT